MTAAILKVKQATQELKELLTPDNLTLIHKKVKEQVSQDKEAERQDLQEQPLHELTAS